MSRTPASDPPPSLPGVTGLMPLDAGGQGEVFAGTWHDGRKVAVRIEPITDQDQETTRQRSDQEGGLLARLAHPNLVPLLAHGTTADSKYVVMEYVEGIDLGREIARRADRPLPDLDSTLSRGLTAAPTRVLDSAAQDALLAPTDGVDVAPPAFAQPDHWRWVATIGVQLCGALDRLHSAGFLHRDIKPRNVMVTPDGTAVLVDLGLATAGDLVRVASDDTVAGTWAYMSPEQRQRRGISTRSDIYGVGCTLYECLTGRPPRTLVGDGTSTRAIAPPSVRVSNPAVPEAFAEVLAICLDPIPTNRYLSARDLGDDLLAVIAGRPRGWRRRPWSRRAITGAAAALALGLTGMTWWAARTTTPPLVVTLAALRSGDLEAATAAANAAEDRHGLLTEVMAALAPEEIEAQRWLAAARGFGRIEVEGCPGAEVGFCPSDVEYQGEIERWFRPTVPMTFVVAPGRYRIVLTETAGASSTGASATLAVRVAADSPYVLRCATIQSAWETRPGVALRELPSEERLLRRVLPPQEWIEFRFKPPEGLRMARDELGKVPFAVYLEWIRRDFPTRCDVFAHPDEPAGTCTSEAIDALRRDARAARDEPLQVSFWWAHRVAGFLGGRLPTANEWTFAAAMSYALDLAHAASTGLPLAPPTEWTDPAMPGSDDPRVGALGLNYLIDSLREWTCTPGHASKPTMICPVGRLSVGNKPLPTKTSGSTIILCLDDQALLSNRVGGVRIVQERFRP